MSKKVVVIDGGTLTLEDNILTIKCDVSKILGESKSGKNMLILNSKGWRNNLIGEVSGNLILSVSNTGKKESDTLDEIDMGKLTSKQIAQLKKLLG